MGNRFADWLKQADADLKHARTSAAAGENEWACFAAQQAAEKAVKAVFLRHGRDAWGHTVTALLGNLEDLTSVPDALVDRARMLDKHYIPTRYPNGFDQGAPTEFYTSDEARTAIICAEEILVFCRDQVH